MTSRKLEAASTAAISLLAKLGDALDSLLKVEHIEPVQPLLDGEPWVPLSSEMDDLEGEIKKRLHANDVFFDKLPKQSPEWEKATDFDLDDPSPVDGKPILHDEKRPFSQWAKDLQITVDRDWNWNRDTNKIDVERFKELLADYVDNYNYEPNDVVKAELDESFTSMWPSDDILKFITGGNHGE